MKNKVKEEQTPDVGGGAVTTLRRPRESAGVPASHDSPRSLDTMSEAIALSSPDGRMSKRARAFAVRRLGEALFGPGGLQRGTTPQPTEAESLLRRARDLRDLAGRGVKPRAYAKRAAELEARPAVLSSQ